ncbi:hypothetical protein NDI39_10010 [Microcoleus sp. ZQ-A2]|nr:hypothetical protein [Microcoleus sp. FACHB-1]
MTKYILDYPYNSDDGEPIYSRRINEYFTLFEFPKEGEEPNCIVFFEGEKGDEHFNFNGWGDIDKEEITALMCTFIRHELIKRGDNKTLLSFSHQLDLFIASIDLGH